MKTFPLKILDEAIWTQYIKDGKLAISVAGNAGVDRQDNDRIDQCNCHIRFNNYATRPGIKDSWGDPSYCDILFSTFDLHSKGCPAKDVVITVPFPFKQERIARLAPKWYPKARKWMVNPYLNASMAQGIGYDTEGWKHPFPSVGTTALMHLHHCMPKLKKLNIKLSVFVCGFEWYYNDKKGLFQNWDLRRVDYPKTWNHNYPLEIEWIVDNLLTKYDNGRTRGEHTGFVFSHRSSVLLEKAKKLINERRASK